MSTPANILKYGDELARYVESYLMEDPDNRVNLLMGMKHRLRQYQRVSRGEEPDPGLDKIIFSGESKLDTEQRDAIIKSEKVINAMKTILANLENRDPYYIFLHSIEDNKDNQDKEKIFYILAEGFGKMLYSYVEDYRKKNSFGYTFEGLNNHIPVINYNNLDKINFIKSMDIVITCLNDEEALENWLANGVPDNTNWDNGEGEELYKDASDTDVYELWYEFFLSFLYGIFDDYHNDEKPNFNKWIYINFK